MTFLTGKCDILYVAIRHVPTLKKMNFFFKFNMLIVFLENFNFVNY